MFGHLLQAAWSNSVMSLFCGQAMLDARTTLRTLQDLCQLLNRPSPVTGFDDEGQWTFVRLRRHSMQAPTERSFKVAARGSVDMQLSSGQHTMNKVEMSLPSAFYHGTSPESLLLILLEGRLASAGNLGSQAHTPDGVYSYSCKEVSAASCYADQGCQVEFTAAYFPISRNHSDMVGVVPEGVACRKYRSAHHTFGSRGIEWVFNPRSCEIKAVRILTAEAPRLMQALKASMADLAADMSQPAMAASSTSLSCSAAASSQWRGHPFDKARHSMNNHFAFRTLQAGCVCVCVCCGIRAAHDLC